MRNRPIAGGSLASSASTWLAAATLLAALACSEDDRPPPARQGAPGGNTAAGGRTAAGGGSGGATDPADASDGQTGAGGSDAAGPPPRRCGDGLLGVGEDCDGTAFALGACVDHGFESGELSCTSDCRVDTAGCSGVERCGDGTDNDGDGLADCDDDECAPTCGDPCDAPESLSPGGTVPGTTHAQPNALESSCAVDGSGPEKVYQLTISSGGTLHVEIDTPPLMGVSVRSDCSDASTERACGLTSVTTAVSAGETLYIVVEGLERGLARDFNITTRVEP